MSECTCHKNYTLDTLIPQVGIITVIVMEGRSRREMIEEKQRAWEEMSLEEHMKIYEDQGIGRKDAMKMVAKDR